MSQVVLPLICIHGHFYQPPRENPWLETIEIQESAAPYHDWNERVTEECYRPNTVARILNDREQIIHIVNNFERISFNVGPTLMSYLEQEAGEVYASMLKADQASMERLDGHGNAIAQVYNHTILPLASRRDKITQVRWGIADFRIRFGRHPEGMWLAETAVDMETLEVLAGEGILFTVLAPSQALRFRKMGSEDGEWEYDIDTRRAYSCLLPGGQRIALFFYDGAIAQDVAFGGLLNDGRRFAERLMAGFGGVLPVERGQLVHIATDGETYGHHHRNGEMALAYCIRHLETMYSAQLVNYGYFLSRYPPEHEVEIVERSSWSCAHGVGRWKEDCGCSTGGEPGWNQRWRQPLRLALDELKQKFDECYIGELSGLTPDPWAARDAYVSVFPRRTTETTDAFLSQYFPGDLSPEVCTRIIRALELQRQGQFMYTSCGWFFNDLAGIETLQVLQYAGRGIQLAESLTGQDLESTFRGTLAAALSNRADEGNGARIYDRYVAAHRLTLTQIGMHFAVHTLFEEEAPPHILNYDCRSAQLMKIRSANHLLVLGQVYIRSRVTRSETSFYFAILYLGNHYLLGNTAVELPAGALDSLREDMQAALDRGNLAAVVDMMQACFSGKHFSYYDLFRDEQMKLLHRILEENGDQALETYSALHGRMAPLIRLMEESGLQLPGYFLQNLSAMYGLRIERSLSKWEEQGSMETLLESLDAVVRYRLQLDGTRMNYLFSRELRRLSASISDAQGAALDTVAARVLQLLQLIRRTGIEPPVHDLQNVVFLKVSSGSNDADEAINELARALRIAV